MIWIVLGCIAGACGLWTVGWLLFYFIFEAKHDASGDGGLAIGVISIIWFIPFIFAYTAVHDYFYPPPPPPTAEQLAEMQKAWERNFEEENRTFEPLFDALDKAKRSGDKDQIKLAQAAITAAELSWRNRSP